MATLEILMPRLSDSMEQGTIAQWLVPAGGSVTRGQELVEIETDKATVPHLAEGDGVLEIIAAAGTTLPVGAPIARLLPLGRKPTTEPRDGAEVESGAPGESDVAAQVESADLAETNGNTVLAGKAVYASSERDVTAVSPVAAAPARTRAAATPLAKRAARLHGVDLDELAGTGPAGRVIRRDVLLAAGVAPPTPPRRPALAPQRATLTPAADGEARAEDGRVDARGRRRRIEPNRVQQLTARRMAESKATVPHFQIETEVAMDAASALREALRAGAGKQPVPSLNDFAVKAAALALRRHPRVNGSYVDSGFELYERVNVGFAVAADDALVVPVVLDADTKSLGSIARETRALAERVRAGTVTPAELSGATFTISNLGMYGVTALNPVINAPQAAILGAGALRQTLARFDGEIVERRLMTLTLSCDHRILDGATAARMLADVRLLLEQPAGLAL